MELLEIVVQGVTGSPGTARVALGPGVTVLHPADGREAVLTRVLLDLLYPSGTDNSLADLVATGAPASRVGLLVQGRDGKAYRLLADVASGKRALLRQDGPQSVPITQMAAEIAQAVTAQLGFPQSDVLTGIFVTRRQDLPSQRPATPAPGTGSGAMAAAPGREVTNPRADRPLPPGFGDGPSPTSSSEGKPLPPGFGDGPSPSSSSEGKPLPPGFGDGPSLSSSSEGKPLPPGFSDEGEAVADLSGMTDADKRARLAEIRGLVEQSSQLKALEFELDGLQKKGFELDEKLKPLDTLRRSVKQADEQLKRFSDVAGIPTDLPEKVRANRQSQEEIEGEIAAVDEEKEKLSLALQASVRQARTVADEIKAAFEDPLVRYGVLAGVGAILVALIGGLASPSLRWVAFLDIPAFAVALFGGWRFIDVLEEASGVKRRLQRAETQREKLQTKLEIEQSQLKSWLAAHKIDAQRLGDVEERLVQYRDALAMKQRAEAALAEQAQGTDLDALEAERAGITAKAKALEEQLFQLGGFIGDVEALKAEARDLEEALAGRATRKPAPAAPAFVPEPAPVPAPFPTASSSAVAPIVEDHVAAMMKTARDVFYCDVDGVISRVQARAAQYLYALSDERYARLSFSGQGEVSAHEVASGSDIPYAALPPGDRDLVYLSVKLTLAEVAAKDARLPIVLERALDLLPEGKAGLLVRVLQFLGSVTQVLVMTAKPGLLPAATHRASLP